MTSSSTMALVEGAESPTVCTLPVEALRGFEGRPPSAIWVPCIQHALPAPHFNFLFQLRSFPVDECLASREIYRRRGTRRRLMVSHSVAVPCQSRVASRGCRVVDSRSGVREASQTNGPRSNFSYALSSVRGAAIVFSPRRRVPSVAFAHGIAVIAMGPGRRRVLSMVCGKTSRALRLQAARRFPAIAFGPAMKRRRGAEAGANAGGVLGLFPCSMANRAAARQSGICVDRTCL